MKTEILKRKERENNILMTMKQLKFNFLIKIYTFKEKNGEISGKTL